MSKLLQVFNRYVHMGGEEKSVDRIYHHLSERHQMERCFFESKDWTGKDAPGKLEQLKLTLYNPQSRRQFEQCVDEFKPDAAIFHNIFPMGSPSLYQSAQRRGLPVIQYVHNFRPFSVGGTLYAKGRFTEEALRGNYWGEVRAGAWQGSVIKSAVLALVLKRLHRSGWLDSVKAWVCISEFIRDKFVQGAGLPAERVHALRHSWDAMPEAPVAADDGYYLFLSRLVDLKGVETLLRAWEILEKKLGGDTPELRIGGEGAMEDRVREAARKSSRVKYLGLVNGAEKHDAIRSCRAMLAPSLWWEPLGLVTYEAYDYGKPMLAARSGGLVETVVQGETGFLHEPGSAEALAEDVMNLESMSAERRAGMGRKGRTWLIENTGVAEWKGAFDAVLRRVVG